MDAAKKFSPALFVLIIFCFVLPFVDITCSGQKIQSLTGFQLITGAEFEKGLFDQPGMFNQQDNQFQNENFKSVEAQPFALFAIVCAALGLIFSFIKKRATAFICMLFSAAGALCLIILKINMDGDAASGGEGIVQLDYQFGYWFSLILFAGAAVLHWFLFREPQRSSVNTDFSSVP
jgi:hypothetical protein